MQPLFLQLKVTNCSVDLLENNDMLLQPVFAVELVFHPSPKNACVGG